MKRALPAIVMVVTASASSCKGEPAAPGAPPAKVAEAAAVPTPPPPPTLPKECDVFSAAELGEALGAPLTPAVDAGAPAGAGVACLWRQGTAASDLRVALRVETLATEAAAKARLEPMYAASSTQAYSTFPQLADQAVAVLPLGQATTTTFGWRLGATVSLLTIERPAGLTPAAIEKALYPLLERKLERP